MSRIIRVEFDGPAGFGNNMLHSLLARVMQARVPDAVLVGDGLLAWGLEPSRTESSPASGDRETIELYGHVIDFERAIKRLRLRDDIEIRIRSLALRMEYFGRHLALARTLFPPRSAAPTGFDAGHIVFVIRTGDIYCGVHPNYTLLPISFYRHLVAETGLKPAFVGQIEDNDYCAALREAFPNAPFCHGSPMDDFHMIRTSCNIVLAVSTFAWLAAWLSESAQRIIVPVIGMLNPTDRPDIDMLPVHDGRYRFYAFPSERWTGSAGEIAAKIDGDAKFRRIAAPRVFRAATTLKAWRDGRLPPGISLWRGLRPAIVP